MITFQLHRNGVILIVTGCVLLAILFVAGGYLAGAAHSRTASAALPAISLIPRKAASPAAQKPAEDQESLSLRVGMATTEEEAKAEVQHLAVEQLMTTIVPVETSNALPVYEIHFGHYTDRRTAVADAEMLQKDYGLTAAVVPAPKPTAQKQ
jgi:hypothetical protein